MAALSTAGALSSVPSEPVFKSVYTLRCGWLVPLTGKPGIARRIFTVAADRPSRMPGAVADTEPGVGTRSVRRLPLIETGPRGPSLGRPAQIVSSALGHAGLVPAVPGTNSVEGHFLPNYGSAPNPQHLVPGMFLERPEKAGIDGLSCPDYDTFTRQKGPENKDLRRILGHGKDDV